MPWFLRGFLFVVVLCAPPVRDNTVALKDLDMDREGEKVRGR